MWLQLVELGSSNSSSSRDVTDVDEVYPKTVDEVLETDVSQAPRESLKTRELFDKDFEFESAEQVLEEDKYDLDGVQIMELYGED
uniref:Uncharacterized protein n=1 Tax=Lactuca sativa TaxID=4236 RepID=A0A9R1URA6_LACSA|nr:hypothetical protein LSAT_V11C800397070 [Lactuca sativa]